MVWQLSVKIINTQTETKSEVAPLDLLVSKALTPLHRHSYSLSHYNQTDKCVTDNDNSVIRDCLRGRSIFKLKASFYPRYKTRVGKRTKLSCVSKQ